MAVGHAEGTGSMKDLPAAIAIFFGICLIIALGLYLLSRWHVRIERRLAQHAWGPIDSTAVIREALEEWKRQRPKYPIISRADLDIEAAAAECGQYDLAEHLKHRSKFERRRHDSAA
jgi:hypothetical protein